VDGGGVLPLRANPVEPLPREREVSNFDSPDPLAPLALSVRDTRACQRMKVLRHCLARDLRAFTQSYDREWPTGT
jgi:hypothetical protein